MTFENALTTMKKYGGRIRRSAYPDFELTIINGILFTVIYDDEDPLNIKVETEIHVSTKDILSEDWEVNIIGGFVKESTM